MKCEFCKKEAEYVIVHHGGHHGQWSKLPTLPICETCYEVARYMAHLIKHEKTFIQLRDIEEGDNETT